MTNSHGPEEDWLDAMGGESLRGSGFETEPADEGYSDHQSTERFPSPNGKEAHDVHE